VIFNTIIYSWALAPFFVPLAQAKKSGVQRSGAKVKKMSLWKWREFELTFTPFQDKNKYSKM